MLEPGERPNRSEYYTPWKWWASDAAGSQLRGDLAGDTEWTESGPLRRKTPSTDREQRHASKIKDTRKGTELKIGVRDQTAKNENGSERMEGISACHAANRWRKQTCPPASCQETPPLVETYRNQLVLQEVLKVCCIIDVKTPTQPVPTGSAAHWRFGLAKAFVSTINHHHSCFFEEAAMPKRSSHSWSCASLRLYLAPSLCCRPHVRTFQRRKEAW